MSRTSSIAIAAASAIAVAAVAGPVSAHPHVWVATQSTVIFENGALTALRYTWLFDEMYTASATDGLDTNNDGKIEGPELDELTKVNIEGLKEFDYFTAATMAGKPVTFGDPKNFAMEVIATDTPPGPQLSLAMAGNAAESPPPEKPAGLWSRFSGWVTGLFGKSQPPTPTPSPAAAEQKPPEKTKVLALHMTLPLKEPVPADALTSDKQGFRFAVTDNQMFIWFEPTEKNGIGVAPGAPEGCRAAFVDIEMDEQQKKLQEAFGQAGSAAIGSPGKAVAVMCSKP